MWCGMQAADFLRDAGTAAAISRALLLAMLKDNSVFRNPLSELDRERASRVRHLHIEFYLAFSRPCVFNLVRSRAADSHAYARALLHNVNTALSQDLTVDNMMLCFWKAPHSGCA